MSETTASIAGRLMERFHEERPAARFEYPGSDGLLRCSVCHQPIQRRVTLWGKELTVHCVCECRKKELEEQKRREEEQEHLRFIQNLKASGIQEKHLLEWRFENAEDSRLIRMAKNYTENWEKAKAENLGLLLWGDVGTGKSFAAACVANALLERGVPVLMTNFSKILNQMGAMYSEERYRYIASFSHYRLLVIDDLGIERGTEFALEQVYAVIDERYKAGLPLIITTNLTISELRSPSDTARARIYSRVLEMCTPVYAGGGDRREMIGRSKQESIKEVLGL